MQAIGLSALNEPYTLTEVPTPTPQTGEVLVQIRAAALNHRDVFIQQGKYPGIQYPVYPGSDAAGLVAQVGEGVANEWLGREVIINPGLNWGNNENHYSNQFRILGMPDAGTWAQYIAIPEEYLAEKPTHLSFEEAASLPLAGVTAWRALMSRAVLQPQEKVLITGIGGGVALFALQFAVAAGAEVWVTSGTDEKIAQAVALGAKGGANYNTERWEKTLMQQAGTFEVVIDSAGGNNFGKLTDLAKPGGRICFYGGTLGTINGLVPAKVFFKHLDILGSTMGSPRDFADMLAFVNTHQIRPVIDEVFGFSGAEAATRKMDSGKQFGKIVLKIS